MMNLRGKSEAQIEALFAEPSAPESILVPPELNVAIRFVLIADFGAALARNTDNRRVDLDASLSAQMREARQAISPQLVINQSQG